MARADYNLNTARDTTLVSSNGTEYTLNILWTGAEDLTDMTLGSSGAQITYENPNDKDKNSYILSSKCTIPFLVQNATDKAFILSLATTYQERDVWITIRETTGTNILLWCGYVLLDLKDEQDVSYPYEVSLTAVDGLAALKDKPFIRETNIDTGAIPKFPYITNDTYYNAGFSNIIGGGTTFKWLPELLFNTGMVLEDDDTGSTTYLENYKIQTAVNLYNEGHPTPASDIDPLRYTQLDMQRLYSFDTDNNVNVPNCYQVLEYICKNFGMRCVYWRHVFHFVEIDEYNTDEDAAGTAFNPINIPTREYFYQGGFNANQNYIGNKDLTPYDLTLENLTTPGEGLEKLSGSIYSGLPAIKTVNGTYYSNIGTNVYRGFPLFPTTWDTSGAEVYYSEYPYDSTGAKAWGTMVDAANADGINLEIYLSFKNTTSDTLSFRSLFYLVAKPSTYTGDPSVPEPWKVCKRSVSAPFVYTWDDWDGPIGQPYLGSSGLLRAARQGCPLPTASVIDQSVGIKAYSTAQDPFCSNGVFPVDAAFTGSWDFTILTFTCYDSNATNEMSGFNGQGVKNFGSTNNHGQIYSTGSYPSQTNYNGTQTFTMQKLTEYQYDYDNTIDASGVTPFLGNLSLSSAGQNIATNFEIDVVNKNTYIYNSLNYFWGDGQTIKISSDGTTYNFADSTGKWVKPTYAWDVGTSAFIYTVGTYDKKLVELLLLNILYNQSIFLKQLNGTTALSETNKYYSGTTLMKYMNPIGKLTDLDNNQYQLMRGTFNLLTDEWETTMNQVFYEVPTDTVNIGEQQVAANSVTI